MYWAVHLCYFYFYLANIKPKMRARGERQARGQEWLHFQTLMTMVILLGQTLKSEFIHIMALPSEESSSPIIPYMIQFELFA